MAFVVKIKFENTLRRLTVERKDGSLSLTFIDLVAEIRHMFQISLDERLVLTYIDQDNDLVTMGDDHDLYDAGIIQKINPLRIHVNAGNIRIQECKEAHLANHKGKAVKSMVGKWCSKETSAHKVQDAVHAYRPSVQATSKLCTVDDFTQRVLQTSHRREDFGSHCIYSIDGKARRNDPSLHGSKHHHRMLQKRSPGGGSISGKLDARFVCDVTIFDGTELVCGTHFTKIWRLRNIGTCPWPQATLLVYTGGDLLGMKQSALVEVPEEGLPCEEEMNIAVDFVAPESPGRYVSHLRLRAPSGHKFGQRVWVLIKAVSKCMDTGIPRTIEEITLHQGPVERDFNNDMPTTEFVSKYTQKS